MKYYTQIICFLASTGKLGNGSHDYTAIWLFLCIFLQHGVEQMHFLVEINEHSNKRQQSQPDWLSVDS